MRERVSLTVATIGHRFPDAKIEAEALSGSGIDVVSLGHLSKREAIKEARRADGVLIGASFGLNAADLSTLEKCRAIVRYGVGTDNIDVEAAEARGIAVSNVPDYATNEVADHTLALLLALARGLDIWSTAARDGRWGNTLPKPNLRRLKDTTLGVIGAGRIGSAVMARARVFWSRILVYDPHVSDDELSRMGVIRKSLEEVLASSEFVTIHVPSTPTTRGLLSAERLRLMKQGAILVNCSRGDLIDERALAACLAEGHIARVGLDVFEKEPPDLSGLVSDSRVWPTPHIAWFSKEALGELRRGAAEEAGRLLLGQLNQSAGLGLPETDHSVELTDKEK